MKKLLLLFTSLIIFGLNAQDVNMQNGMSNQCMGKFYDSGGPNGNVSSGEDFEYTFCPDAPLSAMRLSFTSFMLSGGIIDVMTIYDGDSTAAPLIGMFSNTDSPGVITATTANTSGCLTVTFTSTLNPPGWEADISCFVPCQLITPQIDDVSPSVFVNDIYRVCLDDELTFTGSGMFSNNNGLNAEYNWDFGDGTTATGQTVNHAYAVSGGYEVRLSITDSFNCTSEMPAIQIVQVATEPDFTGTRANDTELCLGESTDIIGVVDAVDFIVECTPPVAGTTFLPDGNGVSYQTCITVDCFNPDQMLDDISNFLEVCVNMEHSYIGDLDIELTSPSGQNVFLRRQAGTNTFLGCPIDNDNNLNPGTGREYCFSPGATPNLTGAPTNTSCPSTNGASIIAGTYGSDDSLDGLLGSNLNGDWCLTITDNIDSDNGYIFEWFLNFDPSIIPPDQSFTPVITNQQWQADPTIIATNGNTITVQPDVAGQKCYTYEATDDFGCTYTQEVCVDVFANPVANQPQNLTFCGDGTETAIFDLTENDDDVLGGQTTTDYEITYHESQADADAGTPFITDPTMYTLTSASQTIFVRIDDVTSGSCVDTASFEISFAEATIGMLENLQICSPIASDMGVFDLTENEANALNGQDSTNFTVTYHTSQAFADAGMPSIATPDMYTNVSDPETIFVRIENNTNTNCFATDTFTLAVSYQPTANAPQDLTFCNDGSTAVAFDLTENDDDVLGGQPAADVTITYYESQEDAEAGMPEIPNPTAYVPGSNPQTIFVRIEDSETGGCFATEFFSIEVFNVDIGTLDDLQVCSPTGPDSGVFDLTQNDANALNGQDPTDYTVTYHTSQANADTGTPSIPMPDMYTNASDPETIFVRVENNSDTTCFDTDTFELTVNYQPVANEPQNIEECDDGSGNLRFDLSQNSPIVRGGQLAADVDITYHTTQAAADSGFPVILTPMMYEAESNPQTIYVRVEDSEDGVCVATESFVISSILTTIGTLDDLQVCSPTSSDTGIFDLTENETNALNGQDPTQYTVTYHTSQADADAGMPSIMNPDTYTNGSDPETIFVRVESNANNTCYASDSFVLNVNFQPVANAPQDLQVCDDGMAQVSIDLTENDDDVLGAQTAADVNITYHESQAEANAGMPDIPDPTMYIPGSNPQTIFVRIEDSENGVCFDTASFEISSVLVTIGALDNLQVCSPTSTTIGMFDLTENDTNALDGQDPANFTVTYHNSQADADAGMPSIMNPDMYTNGSDPETIFVRVESNLNTTCYASDSFELTVNYQPVANAPQNLMFCGDGVVTPTFDLTENDDDVLGAQTAGDVNITYHESQADADAGTPDIPNPTMYTPGSNPQTVFVRIEDAEDGICFATAMFTVESFTVTIGALDDLQVCSPTSTDSGTFDLTENDVNALNGQDPSNYNITYHNSQADADAGTPSIMSPDMYPNTTDPETIFVRVEHALNTTCYETGSFALTVNFQPVANMPQDLIFCGDGTSPPEFDLTENDDDVLGAQTAGDVTISYHESQADADAGTPDIPNPTMYTPGSNPQTVFVRIEDAEDGICFDTEIFTVESFTVNIGALDDLFACDEGSGGFAEFDLTSNEMDALNGQDPANYTVTYHESQAFADAGMPVISMPEAYTNMTNPQNIFVRVENNSNTNCFATDSFAIQATPSAPITDPDPLEFCDSDNDGFGEFDLQSTVPQITQGNMDLVVTFHLTENDAMMGDDDIMENPYGNVESDMQTIFVRVEDDVNGCVLFTELELFVYDSPMLVTPSPIVLCDVDSDNEEVFDLTSAEMELLDGLDPADYNITYHELLSDAEDGMPQIPNATAYTNISNPQTVFVRVTDPSNMADCNNIVELELFARPLPEVFNPTPIELCDDDTGGSTTDEISTFDLTIRDAQITGGAANVDVFYYETTADIPNSPIPNPEAYINTSNPQTLEVRIEDEFGCENFETITIIVNPNPSIADMIFEYELCDVDNDGVEEFDLTTQTPIILNGEPNVTITYYATQAEAEEGDPVNAIDDTVPYQNTEANVDDIYIRAENDTTACFTIRQLNLIVTPVPTVEMLEDLFVCDDDADMEAFFDLTVNTPNALGSQTDVTVTYHETEQSAIDGMPQIVMPDNYENQSNPQEIWIRLEGDISTCVTVDSFMIEVEALPVVNNPTALRVCNDDYDDPAIAIFDLTSKDSEITGQDPVPSNLVVSYYESQADLDADNAIPNPTMYQNTQNNQTIFVGVVDTNTMGQCNDQTSLTLTVLPLPTPSSTNENGELDQEECDDSDGTIDNMATFDLTTSGDIIAMGENVELTYHESEQQALGNMDAIPTPEAYNTANRTIWVRVENGNINNECSVLVSFEVVVNANPDLTATEYTAALCEPEDATPGTTAFNNDEVTNNLIPDLLATDIAAFTVTYHFTQADADSGANAIQDGFQFNQAINNPVYIRVVDNTNATQCYNSTNLAELTISVDTEPAFGPGPEDLFLCADAATDQNTSTVFNLTENEALIDGSNNPDTVTIYYASQADLDAGNAIPDAEIMMYANTSNPQTIIAELFNPVTGCRSDGTVMFDLIVQPLPVLPAPLQMPQGPIVCTDAQGNVLSPFDIGYDLGAIDGNTYIYDWTPDNVDADNDGNEDPIFTIDMLNQTTTYSLEITRVNDDANGMPNCSNGFDENGQQYSVTFEPSTAPFGAQATVSEFSFNEGGEYTVTIIPLDQSGAPLPISDYLYRVDDGPLQTSNVITGVEPGSHVGYAVDVEGCGEVGDPFMIIDYPRFFTPNGDGYNDTWNIIGIDGQPASKIYIFDRYGKLLKQLSPTGSGWDGTFNGRPMPSSDYWFSVEFNEPSTGNQDIFKANFTLKR